MFLKQKDIFSQFQPMSYRNRRWKYQFTQFWNGLISLVDLWSMLMEREPLDTRLTPSSKHVRMVPSSNTTVVPVASFQNSKGECGFSWKVNSPKQISLRTLCFVLLLHSSSNPSPIACGFFFSDEIRAVKSGHHDFRPKKKRKTWCIFDQNFSMENK